MEERTAGTDEVWLIHPGFYTATRLYDKLRYWQ